MSFRLQAFLASALVLFSASVATSAVAQEPIAPEVFGVETTIKPGPNIYVLMSAWKGAGAVNVLSADDLSYKGNVTTGMTPQFALGAKADTILTASAFAKRIVYGPGDWHHCGTIFRTRFRPGERVLIQVFEMLGEPGKNRTCDPLIKSLRVCI